MENKFEYQRLLKNAFEKIPKRADTGDRFKLPDAVCETQGNKTLIKNFGEIASVLRRDTPHFSKYLFKELATPGSVQGSTLILQTRASGEIIKRKIDDYTREFVYCKVCGEPDTKIVKEGRLSFLKCEACGAKSTVRVI
jgi:translation initiation factor 2 subunit 2